MKYYLERYHSWWLQLLMSNSCTWKRQIAQVAGTPKRENAHSSRPETLVGAVSDQRGYAGVGRY
jgi:hypothetical protein